MEEGEEEQGVRPVRSSVQSLTVSENSLFAPGVEDDSFQIEDDMEVDKEADAVQPPAQSVVQEAGQPAVEPVAQKTVQRTGQNAAQPVVKITPQPVQENAPQQVEDVESKSLHHTHIPPHRSHTQCRKRPKIMTHSSTPVSIVSSLCAAFATNSERASKSPLRPSRSCQRRRRPTTRTRTGLALHSVVAVSFLLSIHASLHGSDRLGFVRAASGSKRAQTKSPGEHLFRAFSPLRYLTHIRISAYPHFRTVTFPRCRVAALLRRASFLLFTEAELGKRRPLKKPSPSPNDDDDPPAQSSQPPPVRPNTRKNVKQGKSSKAPRGGPNLTTLGDDASRDVV